MQISRTRIDGPPTFAVYRLEARANDVLILEETASIDLTAPDPLAVLEAQTSAFEARATQIDSNRAMMP